MPTIVAGSYRETNRDYSKLPNYDYDYPGGLDLRPGSTLHNTIRDKILDRARESYSHISSRHATWKKIDRTLTAYVPLDQKETDVKNDDERKPVSIVIPMSYAVLDTLLAYWVSAFLEAPYFKYEGFGPEDTVGAFMLEKIIEGHCRRLKVGLQLYYMFRDALSYGISAVSPVWHVQMGRKASIKMQGNMFSDVLGRDIGGELIRSSEESVLFEGNKLINIDPYKFLPDPNIPVHDVQSMEYVGWLENSNLVNLLSAEKSSDLIFNARYLKHMNPGTSGVISANADGRSERYDGTGVKANNYTHPVDNIWMYVNIIPKDWKLGESEYPEWWLFGVSADSVVINCNPVNLNHGMVPVVVNSPSSDGYSLTPVSELEVTYGMQETMDWLFSSHIANVRRAIHDMFVIDPSLVNMYDVQKPGPTKLIRLRKRAWGSGAVDKAIKQLAIQDITKGNIGDVGLLMDMVQRVTGATDVLQGINRQGSERVSATEARNTRGGAISRLEKSARVASLQSMYDIAYMFASHTQQLMSESSYVRLKGRWEEVLRNEYGYANEWVAVNPQDLIIDYDVVPSDGSVASGEYADTWVMLLSTIAKNPELAQRYDVDRILMHIARLTGAKNVQDFVRKGGSAKPVVQSDEDVMKQFEAGNIVPLNQAG